MFNNRSNKYRHENKYCPSSKTVPVPVPDTVRGTRKKITVKLKLKVAIDDHKQDDILKELQNMRERLAKVENEPKTYNNWIIIGSDMFNDMVDKYGRVEAMSFLMTSAVSGDSVNVIKKLYLDGISPDKYPIACKNFRHFRYLNDKREIIDDKGGNSVQKIFSDRAHRAMVLATNELMQDEIMIHPPEQEDMSELFLKLGEAQCNLASIHNLDIDRLAGMTNNPNHPFFLDEGETYRD